jgi:hypothetical protein
MGHAYLKAADEPCIVLAVCLPRKGTSVVMNEFKSASQRLATATPSLAARSGVVAKGKSKGKVAARK